MITFILAPLIVYFVVRLFIKRKLKDINNKHVVITGGSSGIGKCAGILAARRGAHVTIIARDISRLAEAKKEILAARQNMKQIVTAMSLDVSQKAEITKTLDEVEHDVAPTYMLLNCAGMSICGVVEETSEQQVQTMLNANYLGTLYPIQALVPKMKARKEGIVVLTASQAALMGIFGMAVYSSFKFALRGLAESIRMELKPYNISVTLALPPDTDTPGFANENKTKPEETKLISEAAGLLTPEVVAENILNDALAERFFSFVGFESGILTTLCVGMTPHSSVFELVLQCIVLGPLRLISTFYTRSFDKIVKTCYEKKIKSD